MTADAVAAAASNSTASSHAPEPALSSAYSGWALAFVLVATLLTVLQIRDHHRFNPRHALRKYVVRVLAMVPVYGLTSWLGLRFPASTVYWDTFRDGYESFTIWSFFLFLVEYLDGEQILEMRLRDKPPQQHFFPMYVCLPAWSAYNGDFYRRAKWGTLQYVACKPLMSLLSLILAAAGVFHNGELSFSAGYLYVTFINNLSQIWAMYCLVLLYNAFKEELAPMKPIPKFLCIKALIFFTFWQSVTISALGKSGLIFSTSKLQLALEDFIICVEMLLFATVHRKAFAPRDFWLDDELAEQWTEPMFQTLISAANVSDVLQDIRRDVLRQDSASTSDRLDRPMTATTRTFVNHGRSSGHSSYKPPLRPDRDRSSSD